MTADREELGLTTLRLLAEDCMLTVLGELSRGPVRAGDIETRAAGIPRWTALRRLHSLAHAGFARTLGDGDRRGRGRARSSQAPYILTRLGREYLLQLPTAAARCEQTWCTPPPQHAQRTGTVGSQARRRSSHACARTSPGRCSAAYRGSTGPSTPRKALHAPAPPENPA